MFFPHSRLPRKHPRNRKAPSTAPVRPPRSCAVLNHVDTEASTGLIEDANVFSLRPNATHGNYIYLSIGKVDDVYGVGQVLMRFPGLYNNTTYRNLSGVQILASYLYVHDSTGNGPQYVQLHPVKSGTSWTESTVTYNNMPSYDSTIDCGNTLGTSSEWSYFDITAIARAWKFEIFDEETGVLLTLPPAVLTPKKAPYSSEYSNAEYRPYLHLVYKTDKTSISTVKVNVLYDQAYLNRHPDAVSRIKSELETLGDVLLGRFGIQLEYTGPTKFTSLSDTCSTSYNATCFHGTCVNSTSSTLQSYHQTNAYNNFYNRTYLPKPDTTQNLCIAFLGRTLCSAADGECKKGGLGLAQQSQGIALIFDHTGDTSETATLVHEFLHLYGAIDHYYYDAEEYNYNGRYSYANKCLYGTLQSASTGGDRDTATEINSGLILCTECRKRLFFHAELYDHS